MTQTESNAAAIYEILDALSRELSHARAAIRVEAHLHLDTDLGIDSLARMELLQRLEARLNIKLDETRIMAAATVADLIHVCTLTVTSANEVTPSPRFVPVSPTARVLAPTNATTLIDALHWHVERQAAAVAIYFYPGPITEPHCYSYQFLWQSAQEVAGGLRHLSIAPGQTVALMLPTGLDFLAGFLGILMIGAIPIPIYPPQRATHIEEHLKRQVRILENAEAVALITVDEAKRVGQFLRARLPLLQAVLTVEQLRAEKKPGDWVKRGGQDTALVQYTSGSTGIPKGVTLSHANLLANIRAMGQAIQIVPEDVFVSWLPLYHDMGLIGAWLGSLYHGFPLVLLPPLSFISRPHRWLQAISKHHGTLTAAPNFAYEMCASKTLESKLESVNLSSLRYSFNGAEPVHLSTLTKFCARFEPYGFAHTALAPVYGLAENSVGLCFPPPGRGFKVDQIDAELFAKSGRAVPALTDTRSLEVVACGFPLPDHEVRIVDSSGIELGDRQVGLLEFSGPSATAGYFRNPKANHELVQGPWRRSGDYAYIAAGEVYITGRSKDIIIRAGRNLYPYELEQAVGELAGIQKGNVAVFASGGTEQGTEKLVVLAETRERDPKRRQQLVAQIQELALQITQAPPDDIVLAPLRTVLKTSSGKIRRNDCRQLYEQKRIGQEVSVSRQWFNLILSAARPWMRTQIRRIGSLLYQVYSALVFTSAVLVVWPLSLLIPGRAIPVFLIKGIWRGVMFLLGIRYRVIGREHIPQGPCILVSNHASYLDVLSLGASLPSTYGFVAKKELQRHWAMRVLLEKLGTFFVDRSNKQQGIEDSNLITAATQRGQSIVFFPEGTFTRAPGLRAFKMGAFSAAAAAGLPVLAVAIRGTRSLLRGAEWRLHPGLIEIVFTPLITSQKTGWDAAVELRNTARAAILAHCQEPDLIS